MEFNFLKKPDKPKTAHVSSVSEDTVEITDSLTDVDNAPAQEEVCLESADSEQIFYEQIKNSLIVLGQDNLELVRFAHFLSFKNYVQLSSYKSDEHPELIYYDIRPNFCSMKNYKAWNKSYNTSRLGQCYFSDLFSDVSAGKCFLDTDPVQDIKGLCRSCSYADTVHAFCPYAFAAVVQHLSQKLKFSEFDLYRTILGEHYQNYYVPKNISLPESVVKEISQFDAKSSRAAYLLMQAKCFEVTSCTSEAIQYQYVPLCHKHEKGSLIARITEFWKTKNDTFGMIPAFNLDSVINQKPGCVECEFEQCPDRLAAYYTWLGYSLNKHPVDIAFFAAQKNTISNLTPAEHHKFGDFVDKVKDMPFVPESADEFVKILRYIVNRRQNNAAPLLPINLVIHTNDETLADEFFDNYINALWYFDYFKNDRKIEYKPLPVASVSIEGLIKEYEAAKAGSIFHIKQIELLENVPDAELLMPKLCRLIKEKDKVFTVVSGDRSALMRFFDKYPELYHRVLTHHLFVTEMSSTSVFKLILSKLEENFEVDNTVAELLGNYIAEEYESNELKSNSYAEWLHDKIVFNHFNDTLGVSNLLLPKDIPSIKPRRSEDEIFAELNTLTGLNDVKTKLSEINDLVKYFMKVKRKNSSRPNMHMVFSGSAGTGKTTVAKLMAEILYSIGYIKQNKLVVCSGKDLIAEYLGQSQQKTVQKCEQAYGGILFIDEAYQLNPFSHGTQTDTLKLDAINELIQQMENNRDRLLVIFAGYTKEMQEFIKTANPGLESRIAYTIEFPDYSDEELFDIFNGIAKKEGLALTAAAENRVKHHIQVARSQSDNFGNARFARNLFERSQMLHARNTRDFEEGDSRLFILTEEDITP